MTLDDKIKQKKQELFNLEKQKSDENVKPYLYMEGKYYKFSSTCCLKVTKIDYVDYYVHVIGLVCDLGQDYFKIDLQGNESFEPHSKLTEITQSEFEDFVKIRFECTFKQLNNNNETTHNPN